MKRQPILLENCQEVSAWQLIRLHALRIFKRWRANPSLIIMSALYPLLAFILVMVLFSGFIEWLTGQPIQPTQLSLVIAIMSMFTGAIMGAGSMVQERRQGIMTRFASLPGPLYSQQIGRVLTESLRAFLSALISLAAALFISGLGDSLAIWLRALVVLALISLSVGCLAVMLGYATDTPQGAVALAPLIMIFSFFNTAVLPLEAYAPGLRGLVRYSPITVANQLVSQPDLHTLLLGLAYLLALTLLCLIIISRKVKQMRA